MIFDREKRDFTEKVTLRKDLRDVKEQVRPCEYLEESIPDQATATAKALRGEYDWCV